MILPNVEEVMLVVGPEKITVLKALNSSARKLMVRRSWIRVSFSMRVSML
jgi:hypothetical protein